MKNIVTEIYDASQDNFSKQTPKKARKVKLTLRHLNKLRKKRELEKYENEMRKERLSKIYGSQEGGGAETPMF
jgi:hypothetical protein